VLPALNRAKLNFEQGQGRCFGLLRNHLPDIVAIDMFVVATATFRLLYALIVLSLDRRRVVHFEVTPNPTQIWLPAK
jgi:hypothetical protein